MLPVIWTGKAFVVFLDPIRLEHDPVTRLDERGRQTQRGQGSID